MGLVVKSSAGDLDGIVEGYLPSSPPRHIVLGCFRACPVDWRVWEIVALLQLYFLSVFFD